MPFNFSDSMENYFITRHDIEMYRLKVTKEIKSILITNIYRLDPNADGKGTYTMAFPKELEMKTWYYNEVWVDRFIFSPSDNKLDVLYKGSNVTGCIIDNVPLEDLNRIYDKLVEVELE